MLEGVGFIYEFDCYDGFGSVYGNGFADAVVDFVLLFFLHMGEKREWCGHLQGVCSCSDCS